MLLLQVIWLVIIGLYIDKVWHLVYNACNARREHYRLHRMIYQCNRARFWEIARNKRLRESGTEILLYSSSRHAPPGAIIAKLDHNSSTKD